jgi:hypothetical protein
MRMMKMMLTMMMLMTTMMMIRRMMRRCMIPHPTSQIPGVGCTPTGGAPGPHGGVSRKKSWALAALLHGGAPRSLYQGYRYDKYRQTASSMPCTEPALFGFFVSDRNLPLDRQQNVGRA